MVIIYGSWIYLCKQCLSPLNVWGVLDATLCDKVCRWFSSGTLLSSINKTHPVWTSVENDVTHHPIKFSVTWGRSVHGFLRIFGFPTPITLTATILLKLGLSNITAWPGIILTHNTLNVQKQVSFFLNLFYGVPCDIRAYTVFVSYRRSTWSRYQKNHILFSDRI